MRVSYWILLGFLALAVYTAWDPVCQFRWSCGPGPRESLWASSIKSDTKNYTYAQEAYFADHATFGSPEDVVGKGYFALSRDNVFLSSSGNASGYSVEIANRSISSRKLDNVCMATVGIGIDSSTDGIIECRRVPPSSIPEESAADWAHLSANQHWRGSYEEALASAREGLRLSPNDGDLRARELISLAALGRVEEVRDRLDEIGPTTEQGWWWRQYRLRVGLTFRRHGYEAEANEFLEQAVTWIEEHVTADELATSTSVLWRLFAAYRALERTQDAAALVERVGLTRFTVRSYVDTLGVLGLLAADRGENELALRLRDEVARAENLDGAWPAEESRLFWEAAIAAALGDKDLAVQKLRQSRQGGQLSMVWEASNPHYVLLYYPPYEEFMRPQG